MVVHDGLLVAGRLREHDQVGSVRALVGLAASGSAQLSWIETPLSCQRTMYAWSRLRQGTPLTSARRSHSHAGRSADRITASSTTPLTPIVHEISDVGAEAIDGGCRGRIPVISVSRESLAGHRDDGSPVLADPLPRS